MKTNPLLISSNIETQYTGIVIHAGIMQEYNIENPILVLPNGDIQYYETIVFNLRKHKKLIVILEKGGQNCHLLINSREKNNISIYHLPNALKLLENNKKVNINIMTGDIFI